MLLLLCAAALRCTDEPQNTQPDLVPVTFSVGSPIDESGRTAAGAVPTSLYISLTDDAGTPVVTFQKLKIMSMGDGYITEPMQLTPGFYRITDFALGDDDSNFLYVVPKRGSPLERAVNRPLPWRMRAMKNLSNNVAMQVVDVSHSTPEAFGYTSFTAEIVNPLQVSVFTVDGQQQKLSSADAYLLKGADTVKQFALNATVNTISFSGSPVENYTLVIAKDGFNPYTLDFAYHALVDSLDGLGLTVILNPALSMLAYTTGMHDLSFSMTTNVASTFRVLWGDGASDTYSVDESYYVMPSHTYSADGNFPITVTGDLDNVTEFKIFYDNGWYDSVNLEGLQYLKDVRIGWISHGPGLVDLRYNPRLEFAMLGNSHRLEEVRLSDDNHITYLDISGINQLNTADVDVIVSKIYYAVVQQGGYEGFLNVMASYNSYDEMVGPPSGQAIDKMHTLWETYHWNILPDAVFPRDSL